MTRPSLCHRKTFDEQLFEGMNPDNIDWSSLSYEMVCGCVSVGMDGVCGRVWVWVWVWMVCEWGCEYGLCVDMGMDGVCVCEGVGMDGVCVTVCVCVCL